MKRVGGGDGGLPSGEIKRIRLDPPKMEQHPGGIPAELWQEILSYIFQPGDRSHFEVVCKKWKQIRDVFRAEWPQKMRIQILSSLFKNVKKENLSEKKAKLIEDYNNEKNLSLHSALQFKKNWLQEDFDMYDGNKGDEDIIRNIEALTGISNLWNRAHIGTEKQIDYTSIQNAMTGHEHLNDESEPVSVMKKLITYLLENHKYEMAFAITEVIFATHTVDLRAPIIEFLINRLSFEHAIRLFFALKCQDFFLQPLIQEGCLNLDIPKHGNINDLLKLKTHPFSKAIFHCFSENKIKCPLPLNMINYLIKNFIFPLNTMIVHAADDRMLEIALALKEKLVRKAFEIVPYTHNFECQKGLIFLYYNDFFEHGFIPNPRHGPQLWARKDSFEEALKKIPHSGLAKLVLTSLLDDFYRFSPNMCDWWQTLRKIEKVYYPKFDTLKQFPAETRATEELVYYLIKNHMFIEELQKPSEKLHNFSFALAMLLQQKPSLLNEFLLPKLKEESIEDVGSLSEESSIEILQVNESPLEGSEDEFSADTTEEELKITQREVFDIYLCVVDLLLTNKLNKVAKFVISHIEPETLRKKLESHFFSLIEISAKDF